MTLTPTADRISNYGVTAMACACFSLWVIDTYVLASKQASSTQNVRIANAKSNTAVKVYLDEAKDVSNPETTTNRISMQKNEKAKSKTKDAQSKSWVDEASLHDPDYPKLSLYLTKIRIDRYYSDLYKMLELDNVTNGALRGLLAERSIAMDKVTNETSKTPSEIRSELFDSMVGRVNSEYDEKIAVLLGEEKFSLLREYESTLAERNQIMQFRSELEFSSEPLSVEQETALLAVLENYLVSDPFRSMMIKTMAGTNPLAATQFLKFSEVDFNIFKDVLTPGQIKTLVELRKRENSWRSINYPWKTMGNQMRMKDE